MGKNNVILKPRYFETAIAETMFILELGRVFLLLVLAAKTALEVLLGEIAVLK